MPSNLNLDYYYGTEAEQYSFYRIPKTLLADPRYKSVSIEDKVLYGLLLDRMSLSVRNGWMDNERRVYIYFTQEDAMAVMSCGKDKITRLFRELDQGGIGLIQRKKQGQGRPTRIYVKNFTLPSEPSQTPPPDPDPAQEPGGEAQTTEDQQSRPLDSTAVKTAHFEQSAPLEMRGQDSAFCAPNKTDKNKTDLNDTESSISPPTPSRTSPPAGAHRRMRMDEMDGYREQIKENIDYDLLLREHPWDQGEIDGYVELMAETCASSRGHIRVNGEDVPARLVRERLLKLDGEHIRYVMESLRSCTTQVVNMHIQSIDQSAAIKNIKRKITDLDAMKIQEQKKAVRAGYDMDIIPSDLTTFGNEAKTLLEDLQSRNERMFLVTVLVLNIAPTRQKLENNIFQAAGVAQKYNCALRRLDWQQEQGLMSSLPLGLNQINIQRGLTTSSTAIFVPFTTQELFMGGEALYYGLNALSNNLIMADRKKLKNPNGLILGTPGSGKSFSAKREIANAFLMTQDDIAIIDPENEYSALVQRLGGQVIDISPASDQFINPMDLTLNYSEDDNPLTLKSDFILSLCELIVGGKAGLEPVEKTVIDRCVHMVYRDYLQDPRPEKMPVLGDLYELLRQQPEAEAQRIATALEIYVTGSLNVFNHRTNVKINRGSWRGCYMKFSPNRRRSF